MKAVKKGTILVCSECGLELEVKVKNCDHPGCEVLCCGKTMEIKDGSSGCCCC